MKYSAYQTAIFDTVETWANNKPGNGIVEATAGSGKCFFKGTKILMFDGSIKTVENILAGDKLMGPDSTVRKVLSTTKGHGELCKIKPTKGEEWICNDAHILTLVNQISNEIFDCSVFKYCMNIFNYYYSNTRLFRVGVNFEEHPVDYDPYFIGLWIGDGTKKGVPQITTIDKEIIDYCVSFAQSNNLDYTVKADRNHYRINIANHYEKSKLREELNDCIINNEKRIPRHYLINSRENRLDLLAGLLDADGHLSKNCYEITTKYKGLAEDILFLARSLGLAAYEKERICTIKKLNFKGLYYRIGISGHINEIPCKIFRKIASPRQQIKNVLKTGFTIEPIGQGDYYGFTLAYTPEHNGRFLLGDFTVTHNTTTLIEACNHIPDVYKIMLASFNKHIADKLATLLPRHAESATLNAYGWRICRENVKLVKLNKFKTRNIITKQGIDEKDFLKILYPIERLVMLCKNSNIKNNIIDNVNKLINYHGMDMPDFKGFNELFEKMYTESIDNIREMDFDDQKFQPIYRGWQGQEYHFVMIDEAQDLSPLDIELIAKMGNHKLFVGDPWQSIYGFRGADPDSMDKIKERFGCISLPLSICYRCPELIIQEAAKLGAPIESPTKFGVPNANGQGTIDTVNKDVYFKDVQINDYVLCRTTAPLIKACLKMLGVKPCFVKGRDIGEALIQLIYKVTDNDNEDMDSFMDKLTDYSDTQSEKLVKLGRDTALMVLEDQIESLNELSEKCSNRVSDLIELINVINPVEGVEENKICFMTSHKSKGLEAKNIWLLRRDLFPHPRAKLEWQQKQEKNLLFISVTRCQENFRYVMKGKDER